MLQKLFNSARNAEKKREEEASATATGAAAKTAQGSNEAGKNLLSMLQKPGASTQPPQAAHPQPAQQPPQQPPIAMPPPGVMMGGGKAPQGFFPPQFPPQQPPNPGAMLMHMFQQPPQQPQPSPDNYSAESLSARVEAADKANIKRSVLLQQQGTENAQTTTDEEAATAANAPGTALVSPHSVYGLPREDELITEVFTREVAKFPRVQRLNMHRIIAVNSSFFCYSIKTRNEEAIRVIDMTTGAKCLLTGHSGGVADMTFRSWKDNTLLTADCNGGVQMWKLDSAQEGLFSKIFQLPGETTACKVCRVNWHPKLAIFCHASDALVKVVTDEGEVLSTLKSDADTTVTDVCFCPDGRSLVTASSNGQVTKWSYTTAQPVTSFSPFSGDSPAVGSVAYTSANVLLVGRHNNAEFSLWGDTGSAFSSTSSSSLVLQTEDEEEDREVVFTGAQLDPSGNFLLVAFRSEVENGSATDKGMYVIHVTSNGHTGRFDYVTAFSVPFAVLSFCLSNTNGALCGGEEGKECEDCVWVHCAQTKPIQQIHLTAKQCWQPVEHADPTPVTASQLSSPTAVHGEEHKQEIAALLQGAKKVRRCQECTKPFPPETPASVQVCSKCGGGQEAAAQDEKAAAPDVKAAAQEQQPAAEQQEEGNKEEAEQQEEDEDEDEDEDEEDEGEDEDDRTEGNTDIDQSLDEFEDNVSAQRAAAVAADIATAKDSTESSTGSSPQPEAEDEDAKEDGGKVKGGTLLLSPPSSIPFKPSFVISPGMGEGDLGVTPQSTPVAGLGSSKLPRSFGEASRMEQALSKLAASRESAVSPTPDRNPGSLTVLRPGNKTASTTSSSSSASSSSSSSAADRSKIATRNKVEANLLLRLDKLFQRHHGHLLDVVKKEKAEHTATEQAKFRALLQGMGESMNTTLPQRLETAVARQLQQHQQRRGGKGLEPAEVNALSRSVAAAMTQPVHETFKQCFQDQLLPAFENSTKLMFSQIHSTFQQGKKEEEKKFQQASKASKKRKRQNVCRVVGTVETGGVFQQGARGRSGQFAPAAAAAAATTTEPTANYQLVECQSGPVDASCDKHASQQ
mmetsp:Transcript_6721/g.12701  ORF Transcript_6721/g.12701 Transcript_6721/m.12701 type:complete len:1077 (-) Transcript_6721:2616-5846(-)